MLNALSAAEQAILSGDEDKLYEALKAMGVQNLQAQNKGWYLKQLQADREAKEQVSGAARCGERLSGPSFLTCTSSSSSGVSRRDADQGRAAERRGRGQRQRRRLPEEYAHTTQDSSSCRSLCLPHMEPRLHFWSLGRSDQGVWPDIKFPPPQVFSSPLPCHTSLQTIMFDSRLFCLQC